MADRVCCAGTGRDKVREHSLPTKEIYHLLIAAEVLTNNPYLYRPQSAIRQIG